MQYSTARTAILILHVFTFLSEQATVVGSPGFVVQLQGYWLGTCGGLEGRVCYWSVLQGSAIVN